MRVTGNQVELTARAVPAQEEVWLRVTAPRSLVRAPAAARAVPAPGLGRILADEREGRLIPDKEKLDRADYAYVNTGTIEELEDFVRGVMRELTERASFPVS